MDQDSSDIPDGPTVAWLPSKRVEPVWCDSSSLPLKRRAVAAAKFATLWFRCFGCFRMFSAVSHLGCSWIPSTCDTHQYRHQHVLECTSSGCSSTSIIHQHPPTSIIRFSCTSCMINRMVLCYLLRAVQANIRAPSHDFENSPNSGHHLRPRRPRPVKRCAEKFGTSGGKMSKGG